MERIDSSFVLKFAGYYAPGLSIFLLVRWMAEIGMHSYAWVVFIYLGLTLALPFYAYGLTKMFVRQQDGYRGVYSYTLFLFLFASLIVCLVQYIFYRWLAPDFITNLYQDLQQNIQVLAQALPELAAKMQELTATIQTPTAIQMATDSIWSNTIMGAILGLLYALIFRYQYKKQNTEQ